METTLVTAGVVCVIAAIVGGSLKAFGMEVPGIESLPRQIMLAAFGLGIGVLGIVGIDGTGADDDGPSPPPTGTEAVTPRPTPTEPPGTGGTDGGTEGGTAVGPWTTTTQGLTLTIERVVRRSDGIVELVSAVENDTGGTVRLPLFGNFTAVDDRNRSYDPDPFNSDWPDGFPPGTTLQGTIRLEDAVNVDATELAVHFSTVFGQSGPDSISVRGITAP